MLPQKLKGQWIWLREASAYPDNHVLFRRSFVLDETPASAELWISARTFFHLFVNARHVAYGPVPSPTDGAYALRLDVGYLLETGMNVIAVHAHNTAVTRQTRHRQWSGMWCQLMIDGDIFLTTDREWSCQHPASFAREPSRRSAAEAFMENIDLRHLPEDWHAGTPASHKWQPADLCYDVSQYPDALRDARLPEFTSTFVSYRTICRRGHCHLAYAGSEIRFTDLLESTGEGTFAAEAYLYMDAPAQSPFIVYSDNPYRLILNDEIIKEQGVPALRNNMDSAHYPPISFGQCPRVDPHAEMQIKKGWNRLVLFQHVEYESAPTTLIFPQQSQDERILRTRPNTEAEEGWTLYGPLRSPLAYTSPLINFENTDVPSTIYAPESEMSLDQSADLSRYLFSATSREEEQGGGESIQLKQGQYVILDLYAVRTGCIEIELKGSEDDVINVVTGGNLPQDAPGLDPITPERRYTETLTIGEANVHWIGSTPTGFRYIMIVARKVAEHVEVLSAGVRVLRFLYEDVSGQLQCSDSTLENIWHTSVRTLRACAQGHFYDAPDKTMVQHLPDAMIASWNSYLAFGESTVAARSINNFAEQQIETGYMSAVNGGDLTEYYVEDALCWPIWLQRHFMYTGDQEFLDTMLPYLNRLFTFFAWQAPERLDTIAVTNELPGRNLIPATPLRTGDISTALNGLYCRSLLCGAWLLEQSRTEPDRETAGIWRKRASRVASQLQRMTWDEGKGLFADVYRDGAAIDAFSWPSSIAAIYGGVARAQKYDSIFRQIFHPDQPYTPSVEGGAATPFMIFLVLETAFALGKKRWGIDMIVHHWTHLLSDGTTTWPEMAEQDKGETGDDKLYSQCYGMNALPIALLVTEMAGIRPAAPGFTRAFFEPMLTYEDCTDLYVRIPTAHGHISLQWEISDNKELKVALTSGFPLEVVPNLDPATSADAVFHVSDDVKIITPGK